MGVVAQEIQKIHPEIVEERKNGYLGVDYKRLVPLLIQSVKELRDEVEELKKKVLFLRHRIYIYFKLII